MSGFSVQLIQRWYDPQQRHLRGPHHHISLYISFIDYIVVYCRVRLYIVVYYCIQ